MKIGVIKERENGENRIAICPEIITQLKSLNCDIFIEKNSGKNAGFDDETFSKSGAQIVPTAKDVCLHADIIFKIWAPLPQEFELFRAGQTIIANFNALSNPNNIKKIAKLGLQCFALDLIPRISRAQTMDILSSQNNLAGYKAIITAVENLNKAVPLMMTSAGTVNPVKVLILGVGVAGLQAIATAKRLGAIVYASDIRSDVKEQVESLGAHFIENFSEQLKSTDILITAALSPQKEAPKLISRQMLKNLPIGAVAVDMAAANGGNIEGSKNNQIIKNNGIKIIGNSNLASKIPYTASKLFAQNLFNFITLMYNRQTKKLDINFNDEIIKNTCICQNGKLMGDIS